MCKKELTGRDHVLLELAATPKSDFNKRSYYWLDKRFLIIHFKDQVEKHPHFSNFLPTNCSDCHRPQSINKPV